MQEQEYTYKVDRYGYEVYKNGKFVFGAGVDRLEYNKKRKNTKRDIENMKENRKTAEEVIIRLKKQQNMLKG